MDWLRDLDERLRMTYSKKQSRDKTYSWPTKQMTHCTMSLMTSQFGSRVYSTDSKERHRPPLVLLTDWRFDRLVGRTLPYYSRIVSCDVVDVQPVREYWKFLALFA